MTYKEIEGDLVVLAKQGTFDVITHGCNCFCSMGSGIAPQIAKAFGADKFEAEGDQYEGDIQKLGCIDYQTFNYTEPPMRGITATFVVVNSYTQYGHRRNHAKNGIPLDYEALTLCLRKINHTFPGMRIGLPLIGCGLAGGDWEVVKNIIQGELLDMDVTIVHYKP